MTNIANIMIKDLFKITLGFNIISLIHLCKYGPTLFIEACKRSFTASHTTDTRILATIPIVTLEKLLHGSKQTITLNISNKEDGAMPYYQAIPFVSLLVKHNPRIVLEIGTFLGHTTKLIAQNLPEATVHTMDLPPDFLNKEDTVKNLTKDDFHLIEKRKTDREFLGTDYEKRITQHLGDTATYDFSKASGATFFFIDGSHTYDYCKNDSEKCYELCEGKGVFVWHDCDFAHPGVVQCIKEWRDLGRDIVRIEGTPLAYLNTL